MTGLLWLAEAGVLSSPVALTNTGSVGVVHDALIACDIHWSLPVVAETWDGWLSDIQGQHVRPEHLRAALEGARDGPVAEGCVGGGTGMICHSFKGGIGTSSRVLPAADGGWTVGVLVQANHGQRALLRVDGVPVGREIPPEEVPDPWASLDVVPAGNSSIIVVVATDAPLLPQHCRRLAQRVTLGVARAGGLGENDSGDLFLAFSTANRGLYARLGPGESVAVRALPLDAQTPLFEAVADATEEAILNALCAATTMTGAEERTVYALPQDRLAEILRRYGRRSE
jgi:D-aminopeptidase